MAENLNDIENKIIVLVSEMLDVPIEKVKLDSNFKNDLGGDSLDYVELIMLVEDEFDIHIDDEDSSSFKDLGDLAKYVQRKTTELD